MQDKVRDYLRLEREIEQINNTLKDKRKQKDSINKEICNFCYTKKTGAIKLPDGSCLKLFNNTRYQSLTYSLLEKNIEKFNKSKNQNIPIKELIKFLKAERESNTVLDLKHL